ncbi:peptidyl-tRNA hydrolase-domain-containing protein [Scheffersomyces xylosifermentans]|uniref:peptidyl-tRNA hydrolase-domain-containing protein n=1 Tax=Scheffersomyces xylosifermentans TaxID=1304137 RepID=UPI00315C8163
MLVRHLIRSYFVPIRSNPALSSFRCLFIASIGNPEPQYEGTKHNIGHRFLDQLVNIYWKDHIFKEGPYFKSSKYPHVVLFKSNDSLMNMQGRPISKHFNQFKRKSSMVILHDELQVPIGKYQIRKPTTSARGHNGLKSINSHMANNYFKVAIGIGRPEDKRKVVDYVMTKFKEKELETIDFDVLPKCVAELEKIIEADKAKVDGDSKQMEGDVYRESLKEKPREEV